MTSAVHLSAIRSRTSREGHWESITEAMACFKFSAAYVQVWDVTLQNKGMGLDGPFDYDRAYWRFLYVIRITFRGGNPRPGADASP